MPLLAVVEIMEKKRLAYNAKLFLLTVVATINLLPIVFIVSNSLMSAGEAEARYTSLITAHSSFGVIVGNLHYMDMAFMPQLISLSGWRYALVENPANLRFIWNSIILIIPIVLGQIIVAPLAAYGFERAKAKHKDKLFFAYIILMLLPMQALLVPHFIFARAVGIDGGYLAIIFPAVFATFGVFLIRQQMKTFEKELISAAYIDGANELQAYLRVVLPNIKPALSALTVLAFAEAWNIVDQAVVFISNRYELPMSVHLSAGRIDSMGIVFALSTFFMIPALIVFIYGQDGLGKSIGYAGGR